MFTEYDANRVKRTMGKGTSFSLKGKNDDAREKNLKTMIE